MRDKPMRRTGAEVCGRKRSKPGNAARWRKMPRWSAERRDRPIARPVPRLKSAEVVESAFRRSAPLMFGEQRKGDGAARAAKNRASGALAFIVIPGRAASANPESKNKLGVCLWVPDSLVSLGFRNDKEKRLFDNQI